MKRFDANIGSSNAALEQAPKVLKPVGMNLPVNVLFGMVNDSVSVFLSKSIIGFQGIGIESRAGFNMLSYLSMESSTFAVSDYHSAHLAAALKCSEHDGLVFSASASDAPFAFIKVHIPRFAADESFVHFDMTAQFAKGFILQSQTNAMQHEPCSLLGNAEIAGEFARTDAILAIREQPKSGKPFVKADGGVLAETAYLDREFALGVMLRALPSPALRIESADAIGAAHGANDFAVRPAFRSQVVNAVVLIREINDCVLQACRFVHWLALHSLKCTLNLWASQVNNCPYKGNWYSVDKEKQAGAQLSAAFEHTHPLLQDAAVDAYVERLAQKLSQDSDARMPITIRIVDSDDVYAVTLPGGYQYLSRGLLLIVDDEAGLATVLARGIAHTALRSATMEQTKDNLVQVMTIPLVFLGNSPQPVNASLAVPLTELKFEREAEIDADYFGLQYEYKAGYDPEAFVRVVQKIWSLPRYTNMPDAFSCFPPLSLRIMALHNEIDEILPKDHAGIETTPEFAEFRKHLQSLPPARQQELTQPKLIRAAPAAN